jgi:hypothetical protein
MDDTYELSQLITMTHQASIKSWLTEHNRGRSYEQMLVNHCLNVEQIILRKWGPPTITVICTVRGKDATPSESYFYSFRGTQGQVWERVENNMD